MTTILIVVSGSIEEIFARKDGFPLASFVVLGDGIKSIVGSSLSPVSCEESGRVVIFLIFSVAVTVSLVLVRSIDLL